MLLIFSCFNSILILNQFFIFVLFSYMPKMCTKLLIFFIFFNIVFITL